MQLAQAFGGGIDGVELKALIGKGIALEHLVGGDGGVGHHLALTPEGNIKTCCGGVGVAVERDHIGSLGGRCGGGAGGPRWRRRPLIHPHIIHRHLVREIPAGHGAAQGPADGHVQDDVHRVVKRPLGRCSAAGLFVFVVGVVVVAVHPKANVVLRPPHLVGVEVGDGAAQCVAFLELGVAIRLLEVQRGLDFRGVEVLLRPLHHIDLAGVGPCALTQQPDGRPCAGQVGFCVGGGQWRGGIEKFRFDLHVAIGLQVNG